MTAYVIATIKPWNLEAFRRRTPDLPGRWHLIGRPEDLTAERIGASAPRYIFFPHWSWRIPDDVLESAECVVFHMTDLPYGRGGSPLQNLIENGHETTVISALRAGPELDAGPIYGKRPLDLSGSAHDIFVRAADIIFDMIADIAVAEPTPAPQTGEVTIFRRRTPDQSRLPADATAERLFDHIRMLDAPTYPRAFLDRGAFRLEFSGASLKNGRLAAQVVFIPRDEAET